MCCKVVSNCVVADFVYVHTSVVCFVERGVARPWVFVTNLLNEVLAMLMLVWIRKQLLTETIAESN